MSRPGWRKRRIDRLLRQKRNERMSRVGFYVPKDLYRKFAKVCFDNDITMSECLRLDMMRIVEEEPERRARREERKD